MKEEKKLSFTVSLSPATAILIGSVLISLAILVSNGAITWKGFGKQAQAQVAAPVDGNNQPAAANTQGKAIADIVTGLKKYAGQIGLDQAKFDSCLDSGSKASLVAADQKEGQEKGVGGTPNFFINGHTLSGAYPYTIFKQVIDFSLQSGDWSSPPEALKFMVDGNEQNGEISKEKADIAVGNLPVRGSLNAPVTIIEFSDYECPFCGRYHQDSFPSIKKDYIDTGKVKVYYRDYPLPFHKGAQKSAEAGRCAADQGKFWEYNDLIFANQSTIY